MPRQSKWIRNRTIASMYRDGMTMEKIAERFEISKQRVAVILRDMTAVQRRPRGRRPAQDQGQSIPAA